MKHFWLKKVTSFALVTTMIVLMFTACGSSEQTKATTTSADVSTSTVDTSSTEAKEIDPLGKYDKDVVLTSIRADLGTNYKFAEGESFENNVWNKAYKDILGIDLKYNWVVPQDQYKQKFGVAIASNDLPDVFDVDMTNFKMLMDNDMLADLTDSYAKYISPLAKAAIEDDGGMMLGTATYGGKLMAIPETSSFLDNINMIWIRADWLKKLNLEVPKTMDELVKVAEAFVTQDPDGNGKADTIGLAVNKDAAGGGYNAWADLSTIFYGYHAYPNGWIKDASGNLVSGTIQPEVKTALAAINDMYKKKLIDPEFGVKDGDKVAESTTSGKCGIAYGAMWNSIWPLNASKEKDKADWIPVPSVSIDDKPVLALVNSPVLSYHVVNKNCKNPEAIVKMVNLYVEKTMGPNADNLNFGTTAAGNEVFKLSMFRVWKSKQNLENYQAVKGALESKDTSKLNQSEKSNYDQVLGYEAGNLKNWGYAAVFGKDGSQSILEIVDKEKLWILNEFYGPPTPTQAEKAATLDKQQKEIFLKIIMGKVSIDEFDKFVEQWKKLGGDQITKEVNEWYKAK